MAANVMTSRFTDGPLARSEEPFDFLSPSDSAQHRPASTISRESLILGPPPSTSPSSSVSGALGASYADGKLSSASISVYGGNGGPASAAATAGGPSGAAGSASSVTLGGSAPAPSASTGVMNSSSMNALAMEFPFLRAEHSFDAQSLANQDTDRDPSSICLSFAEGDIVYVHWLHESGWGDVTLLHSGKRGWIPINYFSPFTDIKAIPLLSAAANFISSPKSYKLMPHRSHSQSNGHSHSRSQLGEDDSDDRKVRYTFSQAAINEIVGGVRSLLDASGTLTRDSPVAQRSQTIRRYRKALLTELAYVVSIAKDNKKSSDDAVIDKLVRGCFRIVIKAVAMLDVWLVDQRLHSPSSSSSSGSEGHRRSSSAKSASKRASGASTSSASTRSSDSRRVSHVGSQSAAAASASQAGPVADEAHELHAEPPLPAARAEESSNAFCEQLVVFVHCVSVLESDANASTHILRTTRHCMLACRELLVVVETVASAAEPLDAELEQLKDQMFAQIRQLVAAARHLVSTLGGSPPRVRAASTKLSVVARTCSQLACECSARCQTALQALPDLRLPEREYPILHTKSSLDPRPSDQLPRAVSVDAPPSIPTDGKPAADAGEASNPTVLSKPLPPLDTNRRGSVGSLESAESAASAVSSASLHSVPFASPKSPKPELDSVPNSAGIADCELSKIHPDLFVRNARVRGGSVPALVAWLADSSTDAFSRHAFLLSFRLFASPSEVAGALAHLASTGGSCADAASDLATLWLQSFYEQEDAVVLDDLAQLGVPATVVTRRKRTPAGEQLVDRALQQNGATVTAATNAVAGASTATLATASSAAGSAAISATTSGSSGAPGTPGAANSPAAAAGSAAPSRRASLARVRGSTDDLRLLPNTHSWGNAFRFGSNSSVHASSKLLDFEPEQVAAQLACMDAGILAAMAPSELLDQRFSSAKRSKGLSPHVVQSVLMANHLSAFVGETILGAENLSAKTRKNIIRNWIKIANACYTIGNLNAMVTIVTTLQSSNIFRLRKIWSLMSAKNMAMLERLGRLASPERGFSEYRQELRSRENSPTIPYIGLYLSDLTLLEEGNPKTVLHGDRPVINFDRYYRSAQVIANLQAFQRSLPMDLTENPALQSWLRQEMARSYAALTRDSDGQWRRSCVIEPRA